MRILDSAKIPYKAVEYEYDINDLSGIHAAEELDENPEQVFKTLVLTDSKRGYMVCCIPVDKEVNLKKASKAINGKKAEMIPLKLLEPITGYKRGGCSPIGMKKKFPTFIDQSAAHFDQIALSAGERGKQIFISPEHLVDITGAQLVDLTD